jgi:multicomponent Na+:H+ antiporter subunit E
MIHPWHGLRYGLYITKEVLTGSFDVARDILTPRKGATPMIVEFPMACTTDAEITLMASSITITPGTLTLGITPANGSAPATLFVHSMYNRTREDVLTGLRDMERRLLRATRGGDAS